MKAWVADAIEVAAPIVVALVIIAVVAVVYLCVIFYPMFREQDTAAVFSWHHAEFQDMATKILAHSVQPAYKDSDYQPSNDLEALGVNRIMDDKDGVLEFRFVLERFDGPTRVIIYDPNQVRHGDFSRYITGKRPPIIVKPMGEWTYIKNDD